MTTRKKFMTLAEQHGIEVTYRRGIVHPRTGEVLPFSATLDAPQGKRFAGSDCHCDCSIQGEADSTRTDWAWAFRALEEIVAQGFVDCDDPDCDQCIDH